MKAVVTRVKSAAVTIEGKINGSIGQGFLVLLGVGPDDNEEVSSRLADKICNCRVFSDENGKMNLSIGQVNGEFLVVSQFTLYADLKSRRPGFNKAFNCQVVKIDGHDFDAIENAMTAFHANMGSGKPFVILMNTIKGKGVSFMENQVGWHGKAPNQDEYNQGMADLANARKAIEEA